MIASNVKQYQPLLAGVWSNSMLAAKACLVLAVGFYCLHVLRNINPIFAVLGPLFSVLGCFLVGRRSGYDGSGILVLSFFALSSCLPIIYSFVWFPDEQYAQAVFRYYYMVPVFLFFLTALRSEELLLLLFRVYVVFICLGALSLFFQVMHGPISWFSEASSRDGLVRYSSLVGSLTAYGVYSVFALPMLVFFSSKFVRGILFFIIAVGMFLSLQKAAVVNLLVFFIIYFFYGSVRVKLMLLAAAVMLMISVVISYFLNVPYLVSVVDNIFRLNENAVVTDYTVMESILQRVWLLPSVLYESYGPEGMLWGVGLVGASGTLGFENYPMSHNGIFDLLFVGGVFNCMVFIACACWMWVRIRQYTRLYNSVVGTAMQCMLLLFLINFLFAGVLYLQPYGAIVFYALFAFCCGVWGPAYQATE